LAADVDEILDSNYLPSTKAENDLFSEKQKYMLAVFDKTLFTDVVGKSFVHDHENDANAKKVYKAVVDYYLKSIKLHWSLLIYFLTSHPDLVLVCARDLSIVLSCTSKIKYRYMRNRSLKGKISPLTRSISCSKMQCTL